MSDVVLKATQIFNEKAEEIRVQRGLVLLVQKNNLVKKQRELEKKIDELNKELENLENIKVEELMWLDEGQTINFNSTTNCRYNL